MTLPIQILTAQGGWVNSNYTSWKEIKEYGWQFEYATPEGWIVMTRKGYFDTFRTDPKSEVSPK